jgi:hypothetical protein
LNLKYAIATTNSVYINLNLKFMKKVYLLGLTLFAAISSNAQQMNERFDFSGRRNLKPISETESFSGKTTVKKQKAAGDTLWSEDFANGIDNWTKLGTNSDVWIYDLSGPGGQYVDPSISTPDHGSNAKTSQFIIASPTVDNGFADFISDEYCTANGYSSLDGTLESPVIDLSAVSAAEISFYHKFIMCCSSPYAFKLSVSVSTDDFVSAKTVDVVDGVGGNTNSGTRNFKINISDFLDTAANKSNFKLRFNWAGLDTYFWQVDDIAITEVSSVDLGLSKLYLQDIYNVDYEQTNIPQGIADTLNIVAIISNYGGQTIPTNTTCELSIYNTADESLIVSTSGGFLSQDPSNDLWVKDTLFFYTGIDLSTFELGNYRVEVNLFNPNDTDQSNDTLFRTFNITDGFYGQTNYEASMKTGNEGYYSGSLVPFTFGNITYIPGTNDQNLYGVGLTLAKNPYYATTPNTTVVVNTYELTFGPTTYTDLQNPREFVLTEDMLPTDDWSSSDVYLNFNDALDLTGPITLSPDKYYIAAIYHAGGTDSIAFGTTTGDDDYSSRLNIKAQGTSGAFTWYWLGDQAMVNMDFTDRGSVAGLEENSLINVSNIFPNPTTGETSITYSLANASKVSVKVMDITGKVIYTEKESNQTEGKHTLNINAAAFNSGVYYVTISTDEAQVTKKLIRK